MFGKLKKNLASHYAATNFEKTRIKATYKTDKNPPSENQLTAILQTLSGQDPETSASLAFQTIISKMEVSSSRKKWCYIVKNLIILDRCVEEKLFLEELANQTIKTAENFTEDDSKYKHLQVDLLIRKYYTYIKTRARLYLNKGTFFWVEKERKKDYFYNLSPLNLTGEMENFQLLNDMILDINESSDRGYLKFKVNQYVYLLLLFTILQLYSSQYMCVIVILEKIFSVDYSLAQKWYMMYKKFISLSDKLINFIDSHQFIKGFEISTENFYKPKQEVVSSISNYIEMLEKEARSGNKNVPRELLPELKSLNTSSIQKMMEKCDENFNTFTIQRVSVHFNENNSSKEVDKASIEGEKVSAEGESRKFIVSEDDDAIILTEFDQAIQDLQETRRISASKNYIHKESDDVGFDEHLMEFPELVSRKEQQAKNIVKRQSFVKLGTQKLDESDPQAKPKVFLLIYDDFNTEIFEKFESNFSQNEHSEHDYKRNVSPSEGGFIMTFRLSGSDNTPILKRKTSEMWEDDIQFMGFSSFDESKFKRYKNLYSNEYKFVKELRDKSPIRKK